MSATVGVGERWISMTNGAWERVVENVLIVAREKAKTDSHRLWIARLAREREGFFPGYCPSFEKLFPTHEERAFWAMCFRDAGRWLCIGKLPNRLWGGSPALSVFHTYWCAELLSELLRDAGISVEFAAYEDEDAKLREEAKERESEAYRALYEAQKRDKGQEAS